MKFKQILFAAFLAAFAGMAMVGCNENDPNDPDPDDGDLFGKCMAIDFQARHIAVCAPGEDSAGVGVHPVDMREDDSREDAGAVYIY